MTAKPSSEAELQKSLKDPSEQDSNEISFDENEADRVISTPRRPTLASKQEEIESK